MAVVVTLGVSMGAAKAQPAGPSVTMGLPVIGVGGTVSFSGKVNVGNPVWLAGTTLVTIVQVPMGAAIPSVPGQVNAAQTAWSNASTTLPAGTYNATVTIRFTRAGQPAQDQTATVQFTVP